MTVDTTIWQEAQKEERLQHTMSLKKGLRHYGIAYSNNFEYLNIKKDQQGKKIIEIGCADFPALYFCENYRGVVIEPMPSEILELIAEKKNIRLIKQPVENVGVMRGDEVWFFNVLQHVINPDLFVEKCKSMASVIRFFEPIDYPTCVYHPHTFTFGDFFGWFGNCVKLYNDKIPCFHDGPCAYGVWQLNNN